MLYSSDDSSVRMGDWVASIGSPFGLQNTVTAGSVYFIEFGSYYLRCCILSM